MKTELRHIAAFGAGVALIAFAGAWLVSLTDDPPPPLLEFLNERWGLPVALGILAGVWLSLWPRE